MSSPVIGTYPPPPELPPGVTFALVAGWPGMAADSLGGVWSCRRSGRHRKGAARRIRVGGAWKRLRPSPDRKGYLYVRPGGRRPLRIHHAVLLAFRGERPEGYVSRHLDDERQNNTLCNLQWGTVAQNARDKVRNGRQPRGSRSGTAKLCELEVRLLRAACLFDSQRTVARTFGVSQSAVWDALHGRKWRHVR